MTTILDDQALAALLEQVAAGEVPPGEAARVLAEGPFRKLLKTRAASVEADVCVDPHRPLRTGQGEVVFGQGKNLAQLEHAVTALSQGGAPVLVTRLTQEHGAGLAERFPSDRGGEWWGAAGLFALWPRQDGPEGGMAGPYTGARDQWPAAGECLVLTAGASDLPVALECLGTARFMGVTPGFAGDVGVAGIHRLEPHLRALGKARLVIVIAGMEGALPSVAAGLTPAPVIAVPTSVGYGANFGGLSALLGMLNSCSTNVAVVNIDNGFGAAALAHRLLSL